MTQTNYTWTAYLFGNLIQEIFYLPFSLCCTACNISTWIIHFWTLPHHCLNVTFRLFRITFLILLVINVYVKCLCNIPNVVVDPSQIIIILPQGLWLNHIFNVFVAWVGNFTRSSFAALAIPSHWMNKPGTSNYKTKNYM